MTGPFQGTERFADDYFDQHGRGWKYSVTTIGRDRMNPNTLTQDRNGYGHPIDCAPPWKIPEEFVTTIAKVKGQNRIHLDYTGYINTLKDEWNGFHRRQENLMRQAFKSQYVVGMEPSADVLHVLGDHPQFYQIAEACRDSKPGSAVHQWLIWGEGVMPTKLAEFFPEKVEELARESGNATAWDDEPTGENLAAVERAEGKRSHHKQKPATAEV